jgi:hypothetical protein
MSNIPAILRNLGCTAHLPTLVESRFYSGNRSNLKLEAVAKLRSIYNGKGVWELLDPDFKPLLPISFQNRESLFACLSSEDFATVYNDARFANESNYRSLAREFGGVAW